MKASVKESARRLLDPLIRGLARLGVTPDQVTLFGLALSFGAGGALALDHHLAAAALLLAGSLCDAIDGDLARATGKGTRFGAFFDSFLDRYAEAAVFFGLAVSYARQARALEVGVIVVALAGSLLVSYARARAEGLGVECKVGVMERPERLVVLIVGCALGPRYLMWGVWLLAVLTHVTALQRLLHVRHQLLSAPRER